MRRLLQRFQEGIGSLLGHPIRLGNDRDFASAVACAHLQDAFKRTDLVDANLTRLHFRSG